MSVITDQTIAQFVDVVSGQNHAMAGATIAASAAQATALGLACVQISQNALQVKGLPYLEQIHRLDTIKDALLRLCDQDATAIADFVALREAGKSLDGQRLLCRIPVDVCRFCVETAVTLQKFRPNVYERVHDDMEMSICLLAGAAQAALLLLDSNLRIWPQSDLLAEFEPVVEQLGQEIAQLTSVRRIRI